MKTTKKFLKLFLLFGISFLIYLAGCRKEENFSSLSNKPYVKVGNREYSYSNMSTFGGNNGRKVLGESYTINKQIVDFSNSGMQTLFSDLKSYFTGDIRNVSDLPVVIVLYASGTLSNIDFTSIKAITFFINGADGVLTQRFFSVASNNATEEDATYSETCTHFYLNDLDMMTYLKFPSTIGWALFQHTTNGVNNPTTYDDYDNFGVTIINAVDKILVAGGEGGCQTCGGEDGHCDDTGDEGGQNCGGCMITNLNPWGIEKSLIQDGEVINADAAHDFKNNFLQNTSKGQQYIGYYYRLSLIIQLFKTVNVSNFIHHFSVAHDLLNCAHILQYGENSEIPISSSLKADLLDMIDSYRSVTQNAEYQEMLTQIASDVNRFAGMNRADILSEIQ